MPLIVHLLIVHLSWSEVFCDIVGSACKRPFYLLVWNVVVVTAIIIDEDRHDSAYQFFERV